jgi:ketosteroid isomerase-like protein
MSHQSTQEMEALIRRFHGAMNDHDVEAVVSCGADDYLSEQPAHADRNFMGTEQVRKNWTELFRGVPDFKSDLLSYAVAGEIAWTEWRWHGARIDGGVFDMRGVIIFLVRQGRFSRGCLYMEPVTAAGAGIDSFVNSLTRPALT